MVLAASTMMGWFNSDDPDDNQDQNTPDIGELSKKDIRKRIAREEQNLEKVSNELEKRRDRYRTHLENGAQSGSQSRRVHAVKARIEKFKSKVQSLERKRAVKNLTMWELARGHKEIQSLLDEAEAEISAEEVLDIDTAELQADVGDMTAGIQAEMKEIESMMQSFETSSPSASVETTKEEDLMDRLAAGEVDISDLDLEGDDIAAESSSEDSIETGSEPSMGIEGDIGIDDFDETLPDDWSTSEDEDQW